MTSLEIAFLDEYKRLDAVCADMFHEKNGVTAYLNFMETVPITEQRKIGSWSYDRSTLLRLRHVRNQIAHSSEFSSCTKEDLSRLKNFYDRLLRGEDALSLYSRLRVAKQPRQQGRTKRKHRSRKKVPLIILAIFLACLIIISYIAFHLLSHI